MGTGHTLLKASHDSAFFTHMFSLELSVQNEPFGVCTSLGKASMFHALSQQELYLDLYIKRV